ncbi:hypothetical protein G7Y79_00012g032970 [Physcia stellaris]|nr:hypothetical protein G7Y79_00012g032970 [Physcia stellaris]
MSSFSKAETQDDLRASASKNLDASLDDYLEYAATDECDTGGNGYEWVFRHKDLIAMRQAARCELKSQARLPFRSSMGDNADSHLNPQAVRRLQIPVPPTVTPVSGLPSHTNNDQVEPMDLTHEPLFKKQSIRQPVGYTNYSPFMNGQTWMEPSLEFSKNLERRIQATGSKEESNLQVQDHASGELRRNATLQPPTDHLNAQGTCCESPPKIPSIAQPATLEARRGVNAQYQNEMCRAYLAKTQPPCEGDIGLLTSSEVATRNSPSLSGMTRAPASDWFRPNGQNAPVSSHKMPSWTTFTSRAQSMTREDLRPLDNRQAPAVRDDEPYLSSTPKPSDPVPSSPLAATLKPTPRGSGTMVVSDKTRQSAASAAKATRLFLHQNPANTRKLIPAEATISKWFLQGASFEVLCHVLETIDLAIDRAALKPLLFAVCPELKTGAIGQAAAGTTKSAAHGASSTANRTRAFQPNAFGPRTGPSMAYLNNRYYSASVPRTGPATTYSNSPQQSYGHAAMNCDREYNYRMEHYLAQLPDLATVTNQLKTQDEAEIDDGDFHIVGDPIEDDSEWDLVSHEDAC